MKKPLITSAKALLLNILLAPVLGSAQTVVKLQNFPVSVSARAGQPFSVGSVYDVCLLR